MPIWSGFYFDSSPPPSPHLIISPIVPTSHSIFYLLPVQGNLVIARQHVIINISSAEERSEMQPKIFVWSCLHGLLCSHSLRGAAAHPSSGSHTEGTARIMQDSQHHVSAVFAGCLLVGAIGEKLLHPALPTLQGVGLSTVPQKQV